MPFKYTPVLTEGGPAAPTVLFLSDTHENIAALRDANELVPGQWYEVTNPNGPFEGSVVLLAVSTSEFARDGFFQGFGGTIWWRCRYYFNFDEFDELYDHSQNVRVRGSANINAYPWGWAGGTNIHIDGAASIFITNTLASLNRVYVGPGSTATFDGAGNIADVKVEGISVINITGLANGVFIQDVYIKRGTLVAANFTGSAQDIYIEDGGQIDLTSAGGTFRRVRTSERTLNFTGSLGLINNIDFEGPGTSDCTNFTATAQFLNVLARYHSASVFNISGLAGIFRSCTILNSTVTATSIPQQAAISSVTIQNGGTLNASGMLTGGSISIQLGVIENSSTLTLNSIQAPSTFNFFRLSGSATVNLTGTLISSTYMNVEFNSSVTITALPTSSFSINRLKVSNGGSFSLTGTYPGITISTVEVDGVGSQIIGSVVNSTTGASLTNVKVMSNSSLQLNRLNASVLTRVTLENNSVIQCIDSVAAVTGILTMTDVSLNASSTVRKGGSAFNLTMTQVALDSNSLVSASAALGNSSIINTRLFGVSHIVDDNNGNNGAGSGGQFAVADCELVSKSRIDSQSFGPTTVTATRMFNTIIDITAGGVDIVNSVYNSGGSISQAVDASAVRLND